MHIGILLADELREGLGDIFGDYAEMFRELLQDGGFRYTDYDIRHQPCPPLDACDGYLITGSRHGVYDDLPWLPRLFDFIRRAHAHKTPLLGICFGHQAVAAALGGQVEKSEKGWGLGAHEWQVRQSSAWMTPSLPALRLLCVHQDQVLTLPADGVLLAGSDFCPNAAFSLGEHIFCLQGHPEFLPRYVYALLEYRKQDAPPAVVAEAARTTAMPVDRDTCAQWMINFFRHPRGSRAAGRATTAAV